MPLFLTLTYAPDHLPLGKKGNPSLKREDLSSFIKRYKRDFSLNCDRLTYFGCGEYGDPEDHTFRSHYHLIWFGDDQLHDLWLHDVHFAEDFLSEHWQNGYCDVEEAQWSGIHYVTKYVLKDAQQCPEGSIKPFCVTSNGIGLGWLKSMKAAQIRQQLRLLMDNRFDIYSDINLGDIPHGADHRSIVHCLDDMIEPLRKYMPDFRIVLPSGQRAYLPRKLRRRLVGSFEHFSDNPMWLYDFLVQLRDTHQYLIDNAAYDSAHEITAKQEKQLDVINKIRQRILKRNFNKKSKYESI